MIEIRPIGIVHSELQRIEDCPRQENENAPWAEIEILPQYTEAAKDLKAGDKIVVFTWLSLGDRSVLTTHPRNETQNPLTGVFSTRSPHRPNPIGMHTVKVTAVLPNNVLEVSGLEVLDQTPIIDIKSA